MAKKENLDTKERKHSKETENTGKEAAIQEREAQENSRGESTPAQADKETGKTDNSNINVQYKTENCKVLSYNPEAKELDIDFRGYGIRLHYAGVINTPFVPVRYYGEIGKPGFKCYVQEAV